MAGDGMWRPPAWAVDATLAAVCLLAALWTGLQSGLFDGQTPWFHWNAPYAAEVATGVVTAAAVAVRNRWPLVMSACALLTWGIAAAWPALLIGQYGVGASVRSSRLRVVITLVTVLAVSWPLWRETGADGSLPVSALVCVVPVLAGLYLTSRRELIAGLQDQIRAEERALIARDMHDVVTHRVSLMVLHATALERPGEDSAELARRIQTIGRTALEELRTLVGVLRDDSGAPLRPQPGLADLDDLVTTSRQAGLEVTLIVDPAVRVSSLVEHATYRVVQEALTNVHRHARGAPASVTIEADGNGLRLVVRNRGGHSAELPGSEGGHGLVGIAERIRLVGGELTTRRTADGGFEVAASMPGAAG